MTLSSPPRHRPSVVPAPRGPRQRGRARRPASPDTVDLSVLSGGNVIEASPAGPVLAGGRPRRRRVRPDTFIPVLPTGQRVLVGVLTAGVGGVPRRLLDLVVTAAAPGRLDRARGEQRAAGYVTLIPVYFLILANQLREVDPRTPVPGLRVAFVVTRAPSEEWAVARTTLAAMRAQRFPYGFDVWLCDENPGAEILEWCEDNGVCVSTRYGVDDYHRATWPRRTRCKEGNLAYFYDHWGYRNYDVVAQLDCDHVPAPTISRKWSGRSPIRPSATSPAPSVCDANAARVLGGAGADAPRGLPRAVRPGHNDGLAPMCIGSHYAVRTPTPCATSAGLGPELAEDFSTTLPAELGRLAGCLRASRRSARGRPADLRRHGHAGVPVVPQPHHAALTTLPRAPASPALVRCGSASATPWRTTRCLP